MSRADLGLILSAFSALAVMVGAIAALVILVFFVGMLIGRRQEQRRTAREQAEVSHAETEMSPLHWLPAMAGWKRTN
jgi:cytochrome bd-type quinol oxidase subunit 1